MLSNIKSGKLIERIVILSVIVITTMVITVQSLASVLAHIFEISQQLDVIKLTIVSVFVGLLIIVAILKMPSTKMVIIASVGFALIGGIINIIVFSESIYTELLSLVILSPLVSWCGLYLFKVLPGYIDGVLTRSPSKSILWFLLVIITVIQLVRLDYWVINESNNWNFGIIDPISNEHLCMKAYIYAVDLNKQGVENIYDPSHYPLSNPNAVTRETVDGFTAEDPYQYPPQFLILPYLALAITNSFDIIKIVWFLIQVVGFIFFAIWMASVVSKDRVKTAIWLIPLSLFSFPLFTNFQYGQFQMYSILLGVAAVLLFEKRRFALGGFSLAFAILSKITPGILVIWYVAQRKWKEVGWTILACCVYTIVALLVVGINPFITFFTELIPNLQSGSAFKFEDIWLEMRDLLLVLKMSPYSSVIKLQEMGVPAMTDNFGSLIQNIYIVFVVVLTFLFGLQKRYRYHPVLVGLALINLAGLFTKAAWVDYLSIGSIWLLVYLIVEFSNSTFKIIIYGSCLFFLSISCGTYLTDLIGYFPIMAILTIIGTLMIIILNVWFVLQNRENARISR